MPLLSSFSLGGPTGFGSGGAAPLQEFTRAYTYTGGIQTFAAPAETDSIQAFVWGLEHLGVVKMVVLVDSPQQLLIREHTTFKIVVGQGSTRGRQIMVLVLIFWRLH